MLDRKNLTVRNTLERFTDFDPDKILHKINNYKKPSTPNFKRMISRPNDIGPLPLYMKQIFTRQAAVICNENSLKMNNFAESKFLNTTTSFWPKKSFNKIINLNLITSKKFKENLGFNEDEAQDDKGDAINNNIKKALKFYSRNLIKCR